MKARKKYYWASTADAAEPNVADLAIFRTVAA